MSQSVGSGNSVSKISRYIEKFSRSDLGGRWDDILTSLYGRANIRDVNDNFFRVLGMRRTGNHAIVSWMERCIPNETLHINNIVPGVNGYRSRFHWPEPNDAPEYVQRMEEGFRRRFRKLGGLICSYEDYSVDMFLNANSREPISSHYGASRSVKNILLLRDPFNLFASRLNSGKIETKVPGLDQKQLYIDHAETFLREKDGSDFVCISYNEWFLSEQYRFEIQEKLGLERVEVSAETVSSHGGGSSFDGKSMDGRASQMAVLSRWRVLENDPRFQALFADGELERYSGMIFGDVKAL